MPEGPADQREHHALGQKLPENAAAPCAEGCAHRDLAFTHSRARKHQIRYVGAGDEQNENNSSKKHNQCLDARYLSVPSGTAATSMPFFWST